MRRPERRTGTVELREDPEQIIPLEQEKLINQYGGITLTLANAVL
jgi:hypothetical protein